MARKNYKMYGNEIYWIGTYAGLQREWKLGWIDSSNRLHVAPPSTPRRFAAVLADDLSENASRWWPGVTVYEDS